jgi:hypothetical protein
MTRQEIEQVIMIYRRAPLRDMNEAEAASKLLQKLVQYLTNSKAVKPRKAKKDVVRPAQSGAASDPRTVA